MSGQNWRTAVDATDYFGHQQKRVDLEQRRPVVSRASDLVGPGIGASAIRITDFNDVLATFNGYYSAAAGALNAPLPDEPFVGTTVGDPTLGGHQTFTGLATGFEFTRTFLRNVSDPSSLLWGPWRGAERVPASATAHLSGVDTKVPLQGFTQLKAPAIDTIGVPGTYVQGDIDIFVTRPGVYTGYLRVTHAAELNFSITTQYPDQDTSRIVESGIYASGLITVPFTFWSTGESQEIRVAADHNNVDDQMIRWRDFSITRVGDID